MYTPTGYEFSDDVGHAFVVHDVDGSRIGCAVLTKNKWEIPEFIAKKVYSSMVEYLTKGDLN